MKYCVPVLLLALAGAACTPADSAAVAPAAEQTPTQAAADGLKIAIGPYMQSGLPNQFPVVLVAENGQLLAFAQGTEESNALLDRLETSAEGQTLNAASAEDTAAMQERLSGLLAGHGQTWAGYADSGRALIVISPDASLGECPPCAALLARAPAAMPVRRILLVQQ